MQSELIATICQDAYTRLQGEQQSTIGRSTAIMAKLQISLEALQLNKTCEREIEHLISSASKLEQQYLPAAISVTPPPLGLPTPAQALLAHNCPTGGERASSVST